MIAADVRRRILEREMAECPPPYVGGYEPEEFQNTLLAFVVLLVSLAFCCHPAKAGGE